MHRTTFSKITFGLLVIFLGLLVLVNGVFGWNIAKFSSLIWGGLIVAVSLVAIIGYGFRFWNVFFLVVGAWICLSSFGIVHGNLFMVIVACLLLVLGIKIIISGHVHWYGACNNGCSNDTRDNIDYYSVFVPFMVKNSSRNFIGGKISAVFSQTEVDLTNIEVCSSNHASIELTAVFGKVILKVPSDVTIKTAIAPVIGSCNNTTHTQPREGAPVLYLNGTAVFGDIQIM